LSPNRTIRSSVNVLVAAALLSFGVLITILSARMPLVGSGEIGPGMLPTLLASAIVLFSLLNCLLEVRASLGGGKGKDAETEGGDGKSSTAWLLFALFAAYVYITKWTGLFLSTLMFCTPVILIHKRMKWYKALAVSFAIAACTAIVFSVVFNLGLPEGPFGF